MNPESEQKDTAKGNFIPGYILEDKLGSGGMGTVYKARQMGLDRFVAIKILSPKAGSSDDPQFIARFQREAKIAAKLNHKNIVSIFETGSFSQPLMM